MKDHAKPRTEREKVEAEDTLDAILATLVYLAVVVGTLLLI